MNEEIEQEWLDKIEQMYGVRLGPGQMYITSKGSLYAGSEFVCANADKGPDEATQWTAQISHFPRGLKTPALVSSRRDS